MSKIVNPNHDYKENFVDSDGHKLWTKISTTSGIPIVLCNGGPGCCDYLDPIAALLGDAQIIHFEHRGCGRSEESDVYSIQTSIMIGIGLLNTDRGEMQV